MVNVNDWSTRLAQGARDSIREEAKGMGSIARYVRDDVMPFIGIRVQEGAYAWRPDSDEAVKAVMLDMLQQAGVDSVKGLKAGSKEYVETRNLQAFIRRAVNFYRATCILTEQHGIAPEWQANGQPRFPLAWFTPEDAEIVSAKGVQTHAPFSGKAKIGMLILKDGEVSHHSVTVSEASIVSLTKPKQSRTPKQEGSNAGPAEEAATLPSIVSRATSMLAAADYKVSGDAADEVLSFIRNYIAASDANRAMVVALLTEVEQEQRSEAVA